MLNAIMSIFNGKWNKMPAELAAQVQELTGAKQNLHGEIARVFMITQSGAEGISLANVRQVHIMEAYWNYVRLDQVKQGLQFVRVDRGDEGGHVLPPTLSTNPR